MDERFDTGPLVKVRRFAINPREETALSLEKKAQIEMILLFKEVISAYEVAGMISSVDQDPERMRYLNAKQFAKMKQIPMEATPEEVDRIARAFVEDLGAGRWLSARSRLVLSLQDSLNGTQLENRWKELEKRTGAYRRVHGVLTASSGGPQQLVLVTTQFSNGNDSLFVILDEKNRITGVDFPLQRSDH
jgi:methionyl-tRNA formyltransferase